MSNVTLAIGGRSFTVACAEGEESHVSGLGRLIDEKLRSMGDISGQNEARMLLFASLLLADEVHDARQSSPAAATSDASSAPAVSPRLLDSIATRLENLASSLEG